MVFASIQRHLDYLKEYGGMHCHVTIYNLPPYGNCSNDGFYLLKKLCISLLLMHKVKDHLFLSDLN